MCGRKTVLLAMVVGTGVACEPTPTTSSSTTGPGTGGYGASSVGNSGGAGNTSSGGGGWGAAGTTGGQGGGGGQVATSCGYQQQGKVLHVAANIELCLPPVVCVPETCPPNLGECIAGRCVFQGNYAGLLTLREAWATRYCDLLSGGCHGVSQINHAEQTATMVAAELGHPLCDGASVGAPKCVGIMASSPMVVGNSQAAIDPISGQNVSPWGLGLTEASGLCYEITGPGGTAIVALTDRCGGWCTCNGSGVQECGPCVNALDMEPNCPCVGTDPGLYDECCGLNCPSLDQQCDWCAANNHPHFDLDDATFYWVCGPDAPLGSCQLSVARYLECLSPNPGWPPGGGACQANSFWCTAPQPHHEQVASTGCCCNYNMCPQPNGSCAQTVAPCKAGSCTCGTGLPDADHPLVPSTGCCCIYGTAPQPDGTCT